MAEGVEFRCRVSVGESAPEVGGAIADGASVINARAVADDFDAVLLAAGHVGRTLPGTEEPERLADAFDVDLGGAPLLNTVPVRRLGLRDAPPGTSHTLCVAWVLVPSLQVLPSEQVYTALGGGRVRYTSGGFSADLELDAEGYVTHYPGLAERV